MKFSEALAAIKALENGSELASAIEGELEGLKTKNYEVIGEKRNATTKAQTLETTVTAIAKAAGIEGDLESILTTLEPKVRESLQKLTTVETKLTEAETRATSAESKIKTFERKDKLSEIAVAAGASAAVLEQLLGDRFEELKLEGEGDQQVVKFGDKLLKDAIAADPKLKLFEASLFPAAQAETKTPATPPTKPAAKLPGGTPASGDGKTANSDPVSDYMKRTYAVPTAKS